jgi:hypothetical protein
MCLWNMNSLRVLEETGVHDPMRSLSPWMVLESKTHSKKTKKKKFFKTFFVLFFLNVFVFHGTWECSRKQGFMIPMRSLSPWMVLESKTHSKKTKKKNFLKFFSFLIVSPLRGTKHHGAKHRWLSNPPSGGSTSRPRDDDCRGATSRRRASKIVKHPFVVLNITTLCVADVHIIIQELSEVGHHITHIQLSWNKWNFFFSDSKTVKKVHFPQNVDKFLYKLLSIINWKM